MTHDHRHDPNDPADVHDHPDEGTRVVERQTYVERPADPAPGYVPPAAGGGQMNVNSQPAGYVATATTPGPLYYARRVVSLLFGILAVLIGLRILLLLLVANAGNSIVDFVYGVTEPFVAPFRGIFQFDQVVAGDATFDVAALVALIGWLLIYVLIIAILRLGDRDRATV